MDEPLKSDKYDEMFASLEDVKPVKERKFTDDDMIFLNCLRALIETRAEYLCQKMVSMDETLAELISNSQDGDHTGEVHSPSAEVAKYYVTRSIFAVTNMAGFTLRAAYMALERFKDYKTLQEASEELRMVTEEEGYGVRVFQGAESHLMLMKLSTTILAEPTIFPYSEDNAAMTIAKTMIMDREWE